MGVLGIFQSSLGALNAYSGAISVVANNISNSANEHYSRQVATFGTMSPDRIGGLEFGRGAVLSNISQVVDTFIETRLIEGNMELGEAEGRADFLRAADNIFNELDGNGLNAAMAGFFDSWTALSAEPHSISVRDSLFAEADNMIGIFSQYGTALADLRSTVDDEIGGIIPVINDLLSQIQETTQDIREGRTAGLAFQDDRRALVNELAKYIDLNIVESGDGDYQVYTKAGNALINGASVATFSTTPNAGNDNLLDIQVAMGGTTTVINSSIQSGRLAGLIQVRDTDLTGHQTELDRLAFSMVTEVNGIHNGAASFGLDGIASRDFFTDLGAVVDGATNNISISVDISGNSDRIAASNLGTAAQLPGNNVRALEIAALGDSTTVDFDPTGPGVDNNSYTGHFAELLADVGTDGFIAESSRAFRQSLLDQVKLERAETSGVNVDEEEINLIKYQAAYQASGRLIQVADSILESLVNLIGS